MIEIILIFGVGWLMTNPARRERKRINKAIKSRGDVR